MPVTPAVVGLKSDGVLCTKGKDVEPIPITSLDGVKLPTPLLTKVLMPGPKGSLFEQHLPKGQIVPGHRYAHDVIHYLVSGKMRVKLAGVTYEAGPRDAWSAAPGAEIALEALEDCVLVEFMAPPHLLVRDTLITWGATQPNNAHMFVRWSEVPEERLLRVEGETEFGPPGVDIQHRLKLLIPGPNIALMWNSHKKGKWALHTHFHHWTTYLIKGKMDELFGAQHYICEGGDIWAAQAGALHCTEALEDNELIEFKWPAPLIWKGIIHSWEQRWQSPGQP